MGVRGRQLGCAVALAALVIVVAPVTTQPVLGQASGMGWVEGTNDVGAPNFYVGLFICSHNPAVVEKAHLTNTRIVIPRRPGGRRNGLHRQLPQDRASSSPCIVA